jgi:hypothetical protein
MQAASCEIGKRAAKARDTSIWLLLSETTITALAQDIGALESSKEIWDRSEGWVDMHEFEWLTDASPADVKNREAGVGR